MDTIGQEGHLFCMDEALRCFVSSISNDMVDATCETNFTFVEFHCRSFHP